MYMYGFKHTKIHNECYYMKLRNWLLILSDKFWHSYLDSNYS